MNREKPRERILALRAELARHNRLYYVEARPEISDRDYDALLTELESLEAAHPECDDPNSPTRRVGGEPRTEFASVRHAAPMLSLANTYNPEELRDFDARIRKLIPGQAFDYVVEPKIDGVAVSLRYEKGRLVSGSTRGDGETGDDITANLRTIRSIPLQCADSRPREVLEVRGEVYMTRAGFLEINRAREEAGLEVFANPRNAAAGSLKQLDPAIVAQRPLDAVFYALGECSGAPPATHMDLLELLRQCGLRTVPWVRPADSMDAVLRLLAELKEHKTDFPFEIDGAVIKVNQRALYAPLGNTAKSPRWATAFKYEPERAETILNAITVQVGRTGVLTPVAELEPVVLSGSRIARATLHNEDEIRRKDIRVGDRVVIEKAGEVIPAVVAVNTAARAGGEKIFHMPDRCPACGAAVSRRPDEVALRCENLQCPAQSYRRLEHFCARDAMDITSLGGSVASRLVETGLVREPLDLFSLKVEALGKLNLGTTDAPRILGQKNAAKMIAAVAAARTAPLSRWIQALGLPHIGATSAWQLARLHPSLEALADSALLRDRVRLDELTAEAENINPRSRKNPPQSDTERAEREKKHAGLLAEIAVITERLKKADLSKDIGGIASAAVLQYFSSPAGKALLTRLQSLGIRPTREDTAGASHLPLAGKTFVLTGTLSGLTRDDAGALIRRLGGAVTSAVSGKTDYLVAGENPGRDKQAAAQKYNVPVLTEAEFLKLTGGAKSAPPAKKTPPAGPADLFAWGSRKK